MTVFQKETINVMWHYTYYSEELLDSVIKTDIFRIFSPTTLPNDGIESTFYISVLLIKLVDYLSRTNILLHPVLPNTHKKLFWTLIR